MTLVGPSHPHLWHFLDPLKGAYLGTYLGGEREVTAALVGGGPGSEIFQQKGASLRSKQIRNTILKVLNIGMDFIDIIRLNIVLLLTIKVLK